MRSARLLAAFCISIHSLRVEGDIQRSSLFCSWHIKFQSTPSVWRETSAVQSRSLSALNFNPLPPCGGRPTPFSLVSRSVVFQSTPSVWRETGYLIGTLHKDKISIHSLRVEGDPPPQCHEKARDCVFQSTPSVWRETLQHKIFCKSIQISIHSLRVEGDSGGLPDLTSMSDFNPLPPCGGRPMDCPPWKDDFTFQSTPSVWRETGRIAGFNVYE